MTKKNNYTYIYILAVLFLLSCKLTNPDKKIPSYIYIDKFSLTTDPLTQGTNSEKITDAWVYVDDQIIGAFELPATIPVLVEGEHKISLRPGIKVNGISALRAIYPFYTESLTKTKLYKDSIVKLTGSTTYASSTVFEYLEDFETPGISLTKTPSSEGDIAKTIYGTGKAFEGNYSGVIKIENGFTFTEVSTTKSFVLPKAGASVILEINYKSNNEFNVGIFANSVGTVQQTAILAVRPSATWNKIYVNITNAVDRTSLADTYNIYFGVIKQADVDVPEVYIDNIKLLHF